MPELLNALSSTANMAWRRRWLALAIAWALCLAGWLVVAQIPVKYTTTARILVTADSALRLLMRGVAADPFESPQIAHQQRAQAVRDALFGRETLRRAMIAAGVIGPDTSPAASEALITSLQSRLVLRFGREGMADLSLTNPDPAVAEKVVSELLVIAMNSDPKGSDDLDHVQAFLENQIHEQAKARDAAERRLAQFENSNRPFLPGPDGYAEQLARLRTERAQLEAALLGTSDPIASGPSARTVHIAQLEQTLAELSVRYTDQHPDVIAARRRLEQARQPGQDRGSTPGAVSEPVVRTGLSPAAIKRRIAQISTDIERLNPLTEQIPLITAEYDRLKRDLALIQRNYDALIDRRERVRFAEELSSKGKEALFRVLEPPSRPIAPDGPNRLLLNAGVLAGGLLGGLGFVVALSLLAGAFVNPHRLEQACGRPVLGCIPLAAPRRRGGGWMSGAGFALSVCGLLTVGLGVLFWDRIAIPIDVERPLAAWLNWTGR